MVLKTKTAPTLVRHECLYVEPGEMGNCIYMKTQYTSNAITLILNSQDPTVEKQCQIGVVIKNEII